MPCEGCDALVAAIRAQSDGHDLIRSTEDGCWVVRMGFSEKLRSDSACLACTYLRTRSQLFDTPSSDQ